MAMLGKAHYEEGAAAFAGVLAEHPESERAILALATRLATIYGDQNIRFDRSRFLKACNPLKEF